MPPRNVDAATWARDPGAVLDLARDEEAVVVLDESGRPAMTVMYPDVSDLLDDEDL